MRRYLNVKHCVMIGLLSVAFFLVGIPVHGQKNNPEQTTLVIGKASQAKENTATAREAAISDALNTAVTQKALKIIPPDLMADRLDAIATLIDQQAESFVRTFKVLSEKTTENGYRVLIQAIVSETQLKAAIAGAGLLEQKASKPRLLLLIAEQNVGDSAPRFWWHVDGAMGEGIADSVLTRELIAKGYDIVDHKQAAMEKDYPLDLNAAVASNIGRQYQAEIVITGKAVAITAKDTRVTDLKTYQGTLTVRAYRTDTGSQIGISHTDTVTVNTDDTTGGKSVLTLLAKTVAEDLAPQMAFHRQRPGETNPTPMTIEVYGTGHLQSFVALRKTLNTMPNVSQMQVKTLTPPTAILVVHYEGSLKQMATDLKKITADSLNIIIQKMSVDRLKITLSP